MPEQHIELAGNAAALLRYQQFTHDIHEAFRKWSDKEAVVSMRRWHLFHSAFEDPALDPRQQINEMLSKQLEVLNAQEPRLADIVADHYLKKLKVRTIANQINLDASRVHSLQAEGIAKISNALWQLEESKRNERRLRWESRFELPTTNHLIGIEESSSKLYSQLTKIAHPWLMSVEGIGGIGKTALASELFRSLLDYSPYEAFAWVSARQSFFNLGGGITTVQRPILSAEGLVNVLLTQLEEDGNQFAALSATQKEAILQRRFKQQPHLVVIDNLETILDVETLFPLLERWANPTRFLLTSRLRYESDSRIEHFTVPELSESNALKLVRCEAESHQSWVVANASDEQLRSIYETVGGNPLALRLVVGWSHAQGLSLVLDDLRQARGAKIGELYTYIYRKAWEMLDPVAQLTLLAIPLVDSRCASLEEIASAMDDFDERPNIHQVRYALDRLVQLNLVDIQRTSLDQVCYTIHQLTRTFLQEQVAQWTA